MLGTYTLRTLKSLDVWIGASFETTAPHLLILGESTPGPKYRLGKYVPDWLSGKVTDPTFTALTTACTAGSLAPFATIPPRGFWDRIAFYNFVPSIVTKGASPTSSQLIAGIRPLHLLLDILRPDGVFIVGYAHAPYSYPVVKSHEIPCIVVTHPTFHISRKTLANHWDSLATVALRQA